jgi:hypothetical protein
MSKLLIPIATLMTLVPLSGCLNPIVRPSTPATEASCEATFKAFAKTRPDALNLDEWTDKEWSKALRINSLPVNADLRSETISKSVYVNTITHGQPVDARLSERLDHSFSRWSHGKSYIGWGDTRQNETADFRRHDLNSDGWVTRSECAVTILVPYLG